MPGRPCLAICKMMAMYVINEDARSRGPCVERATKVEKAKAQFTGVWMVAWGDMSALESSSLPSETGPVKEGTAQAGLGQEDARLMYLPA